MTPYEIMIKTNESLIKGKSFSKEEKRNISDALLLAGSEKITLESIYLSINAHVVKSNDACYMYPLFYILPRDNEKKYNTITMVVPHTHIFSSNSYELEILRILALFDRENENVNRMLESTKRRLASTCFGNFCSKGECFETSIIALRFVGSVFPDEITLMQKIIDGIRRHYDDKKRHSGTAFYYRLTLSELPLTVAFPEINRLKDFMLNQLQKSYVMNSDNDKYVNVLCKCILRNCLSRLSEFEYIKEREPFVLEKNGRLYFDTTLNN